MAEDLAETDRPSHDQAEHDENDGLLTVVVGERRDEVVEQSSGEVSWPVDGLCAEAIELARETLLEEADAAVVGDHLGLVADGPMVVTHYFKGSVPGYTGWQWSVTLTRAPDSDHVTVDETALLPEGSALLAPAWVPWRQRIEAGDLGTGDVIVTDPDDLRLIPGMSENDVPDPDLDDEMRPEQWELGLGRERILSPEGRREAAQRWYHEVGPRAALARGTELQCATCGFLLLIGGPLGQGFGVCANGYSPVDGRVVALNFGCGAHSETRERPSVGVAETVIDEMSYHDMGPADEPEDAAESGTADAESAVDGAAAVDIEADDGEPRSALEPVADGADPAVPETNGATTESSAPGSALEATEDPSSSGEATDHATMHEPGSEEGT